jgi:hypothetical protein
MTWKRYYKNLKKSPLWAEYFLTKKRIIKFQHRYFKFFFHLCRNFFDEAVLVATQVKLMYADLALDNKILRDVLEKNIKPEVKKKHRPHESLNNQTPMSFRNKKLIEYCIH